MNKEMKKKWLLLFALLSTPSAWAGDISIDNLFVREMLPGSKITAGYFTLTNNTDKPIALQSVRGKMSSRIEIHNHIMDNGLMKMVEVKDDLVIKPNDSLKFSPGGYHIMVFNPTVKVKKGLAFELVFNFKQAGSKTAMGKVVSVLDE